MYPWKPKLKYVHKHSEGVQMPCFASCNHHDLIMNARHQANLCTLVYKKPVSVFSSNVGRNVKHIKRMDHICFPKWKVSGQGDNWNWIILWTLLISKLWDYFNQTRHSCCIWYAHIYLNDFQGQRSKVITNMRLEAGCPLHQLSVRYIY